jgi:hypothetical protein
MKSAEKMYEEKAVIQTGFFKGATVKLSEKDIIQLMKDYHAQFKLCEDEEDGPGEIGWNNGEFYKD